MRSGQRDDDDDHGQRRRRLHLIMGDASESREALLRGTITAATPTAGCRKQGPVTQQPITNHYFETSF
jgi:hypothetical protein